MAQRRKPAFDKKPERSHAHKMRALAILLALFCVTTCAAHAADNPPVKQVAPNTISVQGAKGTLYATADLQKPNPQITTALLVFHGKQRNADDYFKTGKDTLPADMKDRTIVIAPQFLDDVDITEHHLPSDTLAWHSTDWSGGEDAVSPTPISSYEVIDSILARLSDKRNFPNLKTVILAGHSAGGQTVSRYVVVSKGLAVIEQSGIKVRIVIANPSSYLYFSPERPDGHGNFTVPHKTCNGKYDAWKFGIHDLPRYAANIDPKSLDARFQSLDVTFLLGTADNDPNHPALDKTCPAELQGAFRLERGENYFNYTLKRHPETRFRLFEVNGVGHDGDKMFTSACGQYALFKTGACNHIVR